MRARAIGVDCDLSEHDEVMEAVKSTKRPGSQGQASPTATPGSPAVKYEEERLVAMSAIKRIELVFYMLEGDTREIAEAAARAIRDGLHQVSKPTHEQLHADSWGFDMYPYNANDNRTVFQILGLHPERPKTGSR